MSRCACALNCEKFTGALFDDSAELPHVVCMAKQPLIMIDPARRSGKPCIWDSRITVYDVLECLSFGMTETEIIAEFQELTKADIRACLVFAADRERRLIGAA